MATSQPVRDRLLDSRRMLLRSRATPEGDAALALLDSEIGKFTRVCTTAGDIADVHRAQGAVAALNTFRRFFTEELMIDRGE